MSMRGRVITFVIVVIVIIAAFFGFRYLNSGASTPSQDKGAAANVDKSKEKNAKGDKTLVIYFSLPGQTLVEKGKDPMQLKEGTTEQIAKLIHDQVGGDLVRIQPKDPYPSDVKAIKARAKKEQKEQIFPEIKGEMPDVSQYSKIFIGYPIWLDEQPMVVQTFLRDAHIGNQHVYPFLTSVHTGYGKSGEIFSKYTPDAKLDSHFERLSKDVVKDPAANKKAVTEWVKTLNLK